METVKVEFVSPDVSVVDDSAPSSVSTYALIDCCEATDVALLDAMLSSSFKNPDSKLPASMFERLLPVPLASNVLFVNVSVSDAIKAS